MTTWTAKELVNAIEAAKLEFVMQIPSAGGRQPLPVPAADLPAALLDPDAYAASVFGISKDHYLLWRERCENPCCLGHTRQHRPCQRIVHIPDDPNRYAPGGMDYCDKHQDQAPLRKPKSP